MNRPSSLMFLVGVLLGGCTATDAAWHDICDPDAVLPSEFCRSQQIKDAGADADASDVDPGTNPQAAPTCPGRCVPEPDKFQAGFWSKTPVLLWVGPAEIVNTMSCDDEWIQQQAAVPNDKLFEKWRLYKDLVAPPAECEACSCDTPQGTCSGLPASIEIRAGDCNQSGVATVPFNGPPGWDGSCTNEDALGAGAMCGGVPCAQYVSASPLPPPTNEACAPKTIKPSFTKQTKWQTGALACERKDYDGTCPVSSWHCVRDLPYPWQLCVYRAGIHEECPFGYNGGTYKLHGEAPIDDRGCEECKCGAPAGGYCGGTLQVFKDGACSVPIPLTLGVTSTDNACGTVAPQGSAVGSKAISGISYVPGTCASTGGAPIGSALPDPNPDTAVTFCCAPPFDIAE